MLVVMFALSAGLGLFLQQLPVPQPFPRPGPAPAPTTPAPAPAPAPVAPPPAVPAVPPKPAPTRADAPPSEETLGVPIYPGAQFIASYDAGRSQRYYLFGTAGSFVDLVTYYRNALKQKGELVYEAPATHEFDVGRYNEDAMAFPPGVTVRIT